MAEEPYRLIYHSQNQIDPATGDFDIQMTDILAVSRSNNLRDDITGVLLFNAGCFAQVLEGSVAAIERTFERIQRDARHGDVAVLVVEPIAQRSFSDWAMGFIGQSDETARRFAWIAEASGFDASRLDGERIHALLRQLTIEEEALHPKSRSR